MDKSDYWYDECYEIPMDARSSVGKRRKYLMMRMYQD